MCCRCCSVRQQQVWVFTIGTICAVLGLVFIIIWPGLFDDIMYSSLTLSPDSFRLDKWINLPINIYCYIYLFNWTNVYDVQDHQEKPNFAQVGPYVFRNVKEKEIISWNNDHTISFYAPQWWYFDPEMSASSLNDLVTMPHPASSIVGHTAKNFNRYMKKIVNYVLQNEGGRLAIERTADEWLFKGFEDPLVQLAYLLESELVPWPYEEFGFFLGRNGSNTFDGICAINTGEGDISQLGEMKLWRGRNKTNTFEGECGRLNGTTGEVFGPVRDDNPLTLFIPDVCRSFNMFPKENISFYGVDAVQYTSNNMTFDSGHLYPNMKCYCPGKGEKCPPYGAVHLGSCYGDAPILASHPHFAHADPSYLEPITGIDPDANEFSFYVNFVPKYGLPMAVNASIQISIQLRGDDMLEIYQNLSEFYAPIFIISMQGVLNNKLATIIWFTMKAPWIGLGCAIGLLVIGLVMLSVGTWLTCTKRWKGQRKQL